MELRKFSFVTGFLAMFFIHLQDCCFKHHVALPGKDATGDQRVLASIVVKELPSFDPKEYAQNGWYK